MKIEHNALKWRVATNRHTKTDGTPWGWIFGTPGNVCWSNEWGSAFTRADAERIVAEHNAWLEAQHNAWLEAQRPIAVRLLEASERVVQIGIALRQAEANMEGIKAKKREAEAVVAGLLATQIEDGESRP